MRQLDPASHPLLDAAASHACPNHVHRAEMVGPDGVQAWADMFHAPGGEVATLWVLFVEAPHRRSGLGTAVVAALVRHARALGATRFALDATQHGMEFFMSLGFDVCRSDFESRAAWLERRCGIRVVSGDRPSRLLALKAALLAAGLSAEDATAWVARAFEGRELTLAL